MPYDVCLVCSAHPSAALHTYQLFGHENTCQLVGHEKPLKQLMAQAQVSISIANIFIT